MHRQVPPEATLKRISQAFPKVGITRIANITGLDCIGIPVVQCVRPDARSISVSQGKGLDVVSATVSACMESIETWHAERTKKPLRLASFNELDGYFRVHVDGLPRVSTNPYHPDKTMLWIDGDDIVHHETVTIPFECVSTDYTVPYQRGTGCFAFTSNGLASGNTKDEAILHALCEVIERDAVTCFTHKPISYQESRRVDLNTIGDSDCLELLNKYDKAGIEVAVWDVTSDVDIPAYRAVVFERNPDPGSKMGPMEGMGCHPFQDIALRRALTEAAQARLTLIAGSRDDNDRNTYDRACAPEIISTAKVWIESEGVLTFRRNSDNDAGGNEDHIAHILSQLGRCGMDRVFVFNLTRSDIDIPVVRVVVPKLETYHHVKNFIPGERCLAAMSS